MNKPDIDELIESTEINNSIIELDNYICELCEWGEELGKLSEPQKVFYFNQELEREINNGGFDQYFQNSSGRFAHETVNCLKIIGAEKTSELLQAAINEFPDSKVPGFIDERCELMAKLWPEASNQVWEELDQKFFSYQDNLNDLNMEYVKANRDAF